MAKIFCKKLGIEAEQLPRTPYPGSIGVRIYENICQEAWQMWLNQQTILINEYRLSPIEPEHRQMLEQEMLKFLFGEINA